MMRELLFRGRTRNGVWVYWNGYGELVTLSGKRKSPYAYHRTKNSISYYHYAWQLKDGNLLIKETIGQFTGLKDKNGKKIFEGDIIQIKYGKRYTIGFDDGAFGYANGGYIIPLGDGEFGYALDGECDELAVIGNIHDNPELLEVG